MAPAVISHNPWLQRRVMPPMSLNWTTVAASPAPAAKAYVVNTVSLVIILLACLSGVAYTLWRWHAQIVARINRLRAAAQTWLARWRRAEEPDKPVAEAPFIISAPMSSTLPPRIGTLFARGCLHSVAYPSAAVLAQAARGAVFSMEEDEEERTEPEKEVHHPAPMLLRPLSPLFPLDTTLQSSSSNDVISSPPTPVQFRQHPGTPVTFQVAGSLIDSHPMN